MQKLSAKMKNAPKVVFKTENPKALFVWTLKSVTHLFRRYSQIGIKRRNLA